MSYRELSERLRETQIRMLAGELEELDRERQRASGSRQSVGAELEQLRARLDELRARRGDAELRLQRVRTDGSGMRRGLEALRSAQTSAFRAVLVLRERISARPDVRRRDAVTTKLRTLESSESEVRAELDATQARLAEREISLGAIRARRADAADWARELTERLAS